MIAEQGFNVNDSFVLIICGVPLVSPLLCETELCEFPIIGMISGHLLEGSLEGLSGYLFIKCGSGKVTTSHFEVDIGRVTTQSKQSIEDVEEDDARDAFA